MQNAIVEARTSALGKVRVPFPFIMNGSVGSGNWITVSELIPEHKYIMTKTCKLVGISWSNNTVNADFDLEFYKNGILVGNKFRTYQARNLTYGYEEGWSDSFVAGDWFRVKYIDQGDNVSDFSGFFLVEFT